MSSKWQSDVAIKMPLVLAFTNLVENYCANDYVKRCVYCKSLYYWHLRDHQFVHVASVCKLWNRAWFIARAGIVFLNNPQIVCVEPVDHARLHADHVVALVTTPRNLLTGINVAATAIIAFSGHASESSTESEDEDSS